MLGIHKAYHQNASDFYLEDQQLQTSINVLSANFPKSGWYLLQCLLLNCIRTIPLVSLINLRGIEIHLQINRVLSLFVSLHSLYDWVIWSFLKDCASAFLTFRLFLVSLVVGIVYKDLHELLDTDQLVRNEAGKATRWSSTSLKLYDSKYKNYNFPFLFC